MRKANLSVSLPPFFPVPSDSLHPAIARACSWGAGIATRVWEFCRSLKWPDPHEPVQKNDPGITWAELAAAFTIFYWTPFTLMAPSFDDEVTRPIPYDSPIPYDCFQLIIVRSYDKHMPLDKLFSFEPIPQRNFSFLRIAKLVQ